MHHSSSQPETCAICTKKFQKRHKFVNCALCKSKIHIKCNNIEYTTFNKMGIDKEVTMCIKCNRENFPFFDTREKEHTNFNQEFLASEDMKMFFRGLNDFNTHQNDIHNDLTEESVDLTPIIDCKYFDINSFKIHKVDNKHFSILHLNIGSLGAHKDELETVLSLLNYKFDIIGISETKIIQDITPNYDISIEGYKHFSTPTLANKGGVIIYIAEKFNSKPLNELDKIVSKPYVLESVFAEIVIPNKKNIVLGCIYRHPKMDLNDFNENYLNPLMDKLNNGKHNFLLGDFNVDLMKSDADENTSTYFDTLT